MNGPVWCLALETSARQGSIALLRDGEFVAQSVLELGTAHGQSLLPAVAALLQQHGLTSRDLGLVAVSVGPGSYTGLRVGVVCAKLLAWSLRVPLVAVDTLQAIAAAEPVARLRLWVLTDAQRDVVYATCQSIMIPHTPNCEVATQVVSVSNLAPQIAPSDQLAGSGVEKLLQHAPGLGSQVTSAAAGPEARWVGHLGWRMWKSGEVADVQSLTPVYLRQSSAETQWDRLHPPRPQ